MDILSHFFKQIVDACGPWGSFASVLGLLVSVVGFIITIKSVFTAKKASQQAERAAKQATEKLLRQGTLANFSSSIEVMEQIILLHRKKEWESALEHHSRLRRLLVELKGAAVGFTGEQQVAIQSAVEQFKTIELQIEKAVSTNREPNGIKFNSIVIRLRGPKVYTRWLGERKRRYHFWIAVRPMDQTILWPKICRFRITIKIRNGHPKTAMSHLLPG